MGAKAEVNFFVSDVPMNKKNIFQLLLDHITHHRSQLVLNLRLCGIKPPRYIGW